MDYIAGTLGLNLSFVAAFRPQMMRYLQFSQRQVKRRSGFGKFHKVRQIAKTSENLDVFTIDAKLIVPV